MSINGIYIPAKTPSATPFIQGSIHSGDGSTGAIKFSDGPLTIQYGNSKIVIDTDRIVIESPEVVVTPKQSSPSVEAIVRKAITDLSDEIMATAETQVRACENAVMADIGRIR